MNRVAGNVIHRLEDVRLFNLFILKSCDLEVRGLTLSGAQKNAGFLSGAFVRMTDRRIEPWV